MKYRGGVGSRDCEVAALQLSGPLYIQGGEKAEILCKGGIEL